MHVFHSLLLQLETLSRTCCTSILHHLENHKIVKINGTDGDIYARVELSFNVLKEDEKTFPVLCSLFREDADIDFHLLFKFATDFEL